MGVYIENIVHNYMYYIVHTTYQAWNHDTVLVINDYVGADSYGDDAEVVFDVALDPGPGTSVGVSLLTVIEVS